MAKLTIVKEGDETLRKVCRPVEKITLRTKMLLDDMPVIPVVFQQDAYLASDEISGVDSGYWGRDFKRVKMNDYMGYKESIQNELNEDEAEGD